MTTLNSSSVSQTTPSSNPPSSSNPFATNNATTILNDYAERINTLQETTYKMQALVQEARLLEQDPSVTNQQLYESLVEIRTDLDCECMKFTEDYNALLQKSKTVLNELCPRAQRQ